MAVIISDVNNPKYGTAVATVAVNNGGSGYSATDVLTLSGGDANATVTVETVDGSGAVLTISRTTVGSGYSAGTEATTGGGGAGATIDITVQAGLSTVNGFYRVEAQNLGFAHNTTLRLDTTRTISLTFANTGVFQGIVLCIQASLTSSCDKSIRVDLQQNSGGWSTVASVTMTPAQMFNNVTTNKEAGWFIPFDFSSAAISVTTDASTWRVQVYQTGGTTGNWWARTSDATNPFYAAWCDNQLSFTSGADAIIFKDLVNIDADCSLKGVAVTGDTTRSTCGIICRSTDPTPENVAKFTCTNPLASYLLTMDGLCGMGGHSGFRAGTAANPIPSDKMLDIYIKQTPTIGSASYSGFCDCIHGGNGYGGKFSLFLYGEVPALQRTTLDGNVLNGTAVITTTDATGWAVGDVVMVGRYNGTQDTTYRTISLIAGTTITLSSNLANGNGGISRISGGFVCRLNGYGIRYRIDNTSTSSYQWLRNPSNIVMKGVEFQQVYFNLIYATANNGATAVEDAANRIKWEIKNCGINHRYGGYFITGLTPPEDGLEIEDNDFFRSSIQNIMGSSRSTNGVSGQVKMHTNYIYTSGAVVIDKYIIEPDIKYNKVEGFNGGGFILDCINPIYQENKFWMMYFGSVVGGATTIRGLINTDGNKNIKNNYYDNCGYGVYFQAYSTIGTYFLTEKFGTVAANTTGDIGVADGAYVQAIFDTPNTELSITAASQVEMVDGGKLRIVDNDEVVNEDIVYMKFGILKRCGYGLTDTTAWTGSAFGAASAGQFSIRLQPIHSTDSLIYMDNDGVTTIGDCKDKTVVVTARIKINNAAYYAGTHSKPTLKVIYDGTTEITDVASDTTDAQILQVSFIPTTSDEFIQIQINGATDASGSDAYFYLGKLSIAKEEGVLVDTTGISKWANALPLGTTRTFPEPANLWDAPIAIHNNSGSFGKLVADTEKKVDDIVALIVSS